MSATTGGGLWTAAIIELDTPGGALVLTGHASNQVRIVLSIEDLPLTNDGIAAPVTRTLSPANAPLVGFAFMTQPSGEAWSTTEGEATGTITLTAASTSRITGTFSFIGYPVPNSQATTSRSVTNGRFDLQLR